MSDLQTIPPSDLPSQINRGVHISWIGPKVTFRLKQVKGDVAICVSTKGQQVSTRTEYLRYTRKNEPHE